MNPAQILAILSLLLAFGVNPHIVNNVKAILEARNNNVPATITTPPTQPAPQSSTFGDTPVVPQQTQATSSQTQLQTVTPQVSQNPTCTLTASTTQFYSSETGSGQVLLTWTSTNSTFASWGYHGAGARGGLFNPVSGGSLITPDNGNDQNATITAVFQGNGSSATCTAVVQEI